MSDELREHGADWSDWSEDHPEEGPSCRCGYNGSPEECVASRDELRDGGYTPTIVDVQSYYVMARRSELPPQPQDLTPLSREFDRALEAEVVRRVAEAKAEALNEVADFLDGRGVLWHGDSGVTVMERPYPGQLGRPYSGQIGVRLTDWLRARAVASVGNVSEILTRSEQETL